jgi:hypothetical protein
MIITDIVLGLLILWLMIISYFVYKIKSHYNRLVARTRKTKIDEVLDVLIEKDNVFAKEISQIRKSVEDILYQEKFHYQKIGFLRFNPFERVGGEQSFIIALLNQEDSGLILNFLYTREGVRVYSKKVNKGISEEYELSTEEKEAIKKAK